MPPTVALSPLLVDQSFPRDETECRRAAVALGTIQLFASDEKLEVLITDTMGEMCEMRDMGSGARPYALLVEIYALLDTWLLSGQAGVRHLRLTEIVESTPHPLPATCGGEGLASFWSEEMGKVKAIHDVCMTDGRPFVGVACDSAFAGGEVSTYRPADVAALPLVGPTQLTALDDAYDWTVRTDAHLLSVAFEQARRNLHLLGATSVTPPKSGSHYKVHFKGKRSWILDRNTDPIPARFLQELVELTGYPIAVIKSCLIDGKPPARRHRLNAWL